MAKEDVSARITDLLNEYFSSEEAAKLQLEVYRVQYRKEGKGWILRVFLDKTADAEEQYVNIDECEAVTRYLSDKLDELDFIDRSYNLEVSSPGLDRELIKDSDYDRFAGRLVEVKTYEAIVIGSAGGKGKPNSVKNFEGTLIGKENGIVKISVGDEELNIPQEKISKINLAVVF